MPLPLVASVARPKVEHRAARRVALAARNKLDPVVPVGEVQASERLDDDACAVVGPLSDVALFELIRRTVQLDEANDEAAGRIVDRSNLGRKGCVPLATNTSRNRE